MLPQSLISQKQYCPNWLLVFRNAIHLVYINIVSMCFNEFCHYLQESFLLPFLSFSGIESCHPKTLILCLYILALKFFLYHFLHFVNYAG